MTVNQPSTHDLANTMRTRYLAADRRQKWRT